MKAIIFDFDGLILDTETPDYQSWLEVYQEHGCDLPLAVWQENIGSVSFFDPFGYLEQQLGRPIDRQAVGQRRRQRDDALLATQPILPGVEVYLAEARRLGLKVGLASSSRHDWVDGHLGRLGLLDHFDVIRCRDDVDDRSKPDPAVYQVTLAALDVQAQETLALEDSLNGVKAAKQAGLFCVAVPNPMTRHFDFTLADHRLRSLADESLAQLIARLNGRG